MTNVLGIPIPSSDPLFLSTVGIHAVFGLSAVATGLGAMFSSKGRGRHSRFGTYYFWSLTGLFVTASALAFVRWSEDYHLFFLGAFSFAAALFARLAIRRGLPRLHLSGMATSYVLTLTAFYVDNGKNLPIWRDLPHIAYWIVPAAVGVPVTVYYLFRLPRIVERSSRTASQRAS
jgi:hypothetical protein